VEDIVPWLVSAAGLAGVLGALSWLAARTRRRGAGQDIMGPVDLIYRPHTHQINLETRTHGERLVALPPAEGLRPARLPEGPGDGRDVTSMG
jgi:hypothetical protein